MRSSAILALGAAGLAILAALAAQRLWHPHARAPNAAVSAPLATPPGITMQLVSERKPASGSGEPRIVFADHQGMTLYTYASDTVSGAGAQAVSACAGDCAKTWPPALAARDTEAAIDWSVLRRGDGSRQWCYRGAPLYRFAGDEAPGEIRGQGAGAGAWHAAAFLPEVGMVLPDSIMVRHLPDAGGTALTSIEGLTLYTFDGTQARPDADCGGRANCAPHWWPFEAGAIANSAGDFAVIARPDGITQWTYRDQPLYLFDGDRKPGEVRGAGVDERFQVALVRRYFMQPDATIRWIPGLGNALVTRSGATLYARDRVQPGEDNHDFHHDHGPPALGRFYGTSTCDAGCARTWQPYAAPADAAASGYWDVFTRPDGRKQWAYKGFALYQYSADAPGEARGSQAYELVRIDDVGPRVDTAGETRASLQLSARDEAAYVRFAGGGNAAGTGVGALFWRAVAP